MAIFLPCNSFAIEVILSICLHHLEYPTKASPKRL